MKCGDLRSQVLLPTADLLEAGNSPVEARALRILASILEAAPTKTVADTVKRLRNLEPQASGRDADGSGSVVDVLHALSTLLKSLAKQPAAKDVDVIRELLQEYQEVPIEALASTAIEALRFAAPAKKPKKSTAKPVRDDLVERYHRRLEEALGDEPGFADVFSRLTNDPDMGSAELSLLAKRFSLANARGREIALKKIMSRQQALMTSRARSAATAGRIAG